MTYSIKQHLKAWNKRSLVYTILMLVIAIGVTLPVNRITSYHLENQNTIKIDDGWKIEVHHGDQVERYENVRFSETVLGMCNKGDWLVYEHTFLPSEQMANALLELNIVHSAVEVTMDHMRVYEYGLENMSQGKMVGYGNCIFGIPENYVHKKMQIVLHVTENDAFSAQQIPVIANGATYMQTRLARNRLNLALSIFLIVFGVVTMFICVLMPKVASGFEQFYCIAIFSVLTGVYSMCSSGAILLFNNDIYMKSNIEYETLYLLPIPFTLYFKSRIFDEGVRRILRYIYAVILGSEIVLFLVACTMNYTNLAHFPKFLTIGHLIMGVALLSIFAITIRDLMHRRKGSASMTIGFAVATIIVSLEIIRFNVEKYVSGFSENEFISTVSFAVFAIVLAMIVDFAFKTSRNLYQNARQELLEQIAYVDELTGLVNRRRCDEVILEYEREETAYSVISFDLNLLKQTNDTLGHEAGDRLLRSFAKVLLEVFGKDYVVGRMGGDEFIVILKDADLEQTHQLLAELDARIAQFNACEETLRLSTAYGAACNCEVAKEDGRHATYRLADARMYARKRLMKESRKD